MMLAVGEKVNYVYVFITIDSDVNILFSFGSM